MNIKRISKAFLIPLIVFFGLIAYLLLDALHLFLLAYITIGITIILGSYDLVKDSYEDLRAKQFGLDYIAILAVMVAILSREFLVAGVIALMLSTGRTLEKYAAEQAKKSLSFLAERIPRIVSRVKDHTTQSIAIEKITKGEIILVRKGEVIPLDGVLLTETAVIDESSLTGEAYPVDKVKDDTVRSGTVNLGDPVHIRVTAEEENSSYKKIVLLVQRAQVSKAPLVRLADKYSLWFTVITLLIAGFSYLLNHTLESILAVLVVATPCPLILATPIALMGGMNKAAKKRMILKKLASLEIVSRVTAIVFDKTGTITFGKPQVTGFTIKDQKRERKQLLAISEAIERNSLHPLAKAIVHFAESNHSLRFHAEMISEVVGKGVTGRVQGKTYSLTKLPSTTTSDMEIGLFEKNQLLAIFSFTDEIKSDSKQVMRQLIEKGIHLSLFTGDKKAVAQKVLAHIGLPISLKAECQPEDKLRGVEQLKKEGNVTAMVGDGINDAPALALADVGMVFSNEEQTAASEAADIVFLGGNLSSVFAMLLIAKRTITIAKQSIFWGIGMSIGCMIFAAFGYIPPLFGAIIQEVIDVIVILNALRASR